MAETVLEQPKRRHPHRKNYSEEEIHAGLLELLMCHGNHRRASAQLADRDVRIPPDTLRGWKNHTHASRYEQLRKEVLPRLQARMAAEAEDLAGAYAEAERDAIFLFRARRMHLEPKDLAKAAQQMAVARGISTEKALLLRGQPTSIVERRDIEDLFARLGAADDENVVDAEVVEESALPA